MGICSRCGRKAETEYGVDGQPYCSSCIFYGLNKQCWKCRMYLPASELQQYRGQWICPNCLMDLRDEEKGKEDNMSRSYRYSERCQRCGRESDRFYMWNGRRLCIYCLDEEQAKWGTAGGGPMGGGSRVLVRPLRVSDQPSFIGRIISAILVKIGLKKKSEPEIVALSREQTPFNRAKTLTERKIKQDKEASTQVEGIMKDDERVQAESILKKKPRKIRKKTKKKSSKKKK